MPAKSSTAQQLPLVADISSVYAAREKEIRELALRSMSLNGITIDLVARIAGIKHPEQLSRALAGNGTHVPSTAYAVLLDPAVDQKAVFVSGLCVMAKGEFKARPEISDEEFRRRVEKYARGSEMAGLFLVEALGDAR